MRTPIRLATAIACLAGVVLSSGCAHHLHPQRDVDRNPPGLLGGPGTNWENPPGPAGGPGTSPDRRPWR